ncbi:aminotransferase class IV [Promicromonospora sp. AC04]|uniref:aminotransferase class IV n=1 Tax=Promicromonospora sp. AC04 TaxID=2135723 RepID=UPI000D3A85E0|nr:aminotransferase class IV [Promicromonospora sp. AC04]
MTVIWTEGRMVAPGEAALSAVDHGITVGDGVFETCAVLNGHAFALTRHLARLERSASGMGMAAPDLRKVRDGVDAVLAATPDAGRLRITVTDGVGPLASGRSDGPQTVIVAATEAVIVPTGRAARSPWTRNENSAVAGLKTTSYAENVVSLADAIRKGADESVFANTQGDLCEGTGSNVFLEIDGELVTPPLSSGCLAGITRELLLEWGAEEGLPVREAKDGELPFSVLDRVASGEARMLLTGSVRNVQPTVWLDGVDLEIGELSSAARDVFERFMRERLDP